MKGDSCLTYSSYLALNVVLHGSVMTSPVRPLLVALWVFGAAAICAGTASVTLAQEPAPVRPAVGTPPASPGIGGRAGSEPAGATSPSDRGLRFLELEESRTPVDAGIARPRRRFAVCIGIDGYPSGCGYGRLQFAGNDAIAVAESLLARCAFDRVLLMTDANVPQEILGKFIGPRLEVDKDLRRDTIRNRIESFLAQATGVDDVIVFYYAGHADAGRTAYLVPIDYHKKQAPTKTIGVSEIFQLLMSEPIYARNKLVILDACRSSPTDPDGRIMAPGFREALVQPDQRMMVITACDARESSHESVELQHGRFTWALIQAMAGDAYPPGEENLLVTDICKYVANIFESKGWGGSRAEGAGRQNPQLFSTGLLVFALAHWEVPKPQPLDQFEWEDLRRDHREARKLYLGNQLEQASSKYRYCLRVIESPPQEDQTVRRLRGRLLAERARTSYRLGRPAAVEADLKLAESLTDNDPAALEVRGYLAYDGGHYDQAAGQLERAIAGQAVDGDIPGYLFFRLGMALHHLERFEPAATYFLKATEASERFALKRDAAQYRRWAAQSFAAVSRLDVAEKLLRDVLSRLKGLPGEDSQLEVAATRLALAEVLSDGGQYRQAIDEASAALAIVRKGGRTKLPDLTRCLHLLADIQERMGDYPGSEARYQEALKLLEGVADRPGQGYARLLNDLAGLYLRQGRYSRAVDLLRRSLEITAETRGKEISQYAIILSNLGLAYYFEGEYPRAEPLMRQALAIQRKVRGEKHPQTASNLHNLAMLLEAKGDFVRARTSFEQALAIRRQSLGEQHPDTAASLDNLARLLVAQGDYAAARPLYEQALAIRRKGLPPDHPYIAQSLNNLGLLQSELREYAAAKQSHEQALAIYRKSLPRNHPDVATALNNLASLLRDQGNYPAARPLMEQAVMIYRQALGEHHPNYAKALSNLALLLEEQGDYAAARPLMERALVIRKEMLGDRHPDTAESLSNLAALLRTQGDSAGAEPLLRQALEIDQSNLQLAAAGLSEREQLAMARKFRPSLDAYMSLAPEAHRSSDTAYVFILRSKGTVFEHQRRLRAERMLLREAHDPEVARLFGELQETARRLATLAMATPDPKQAQAWRAKIAELTERKEHLEADLARRSAVFRAGRKQPTPAQLQAALPRDVALVDFLEYTHSSPPPQGKGKLRSERRVVAFVVRPDRPIARLDLGPIEPIEVAVDRWRRSYGAGKTPPAGETDPGAELRKRLWEPLAQHLEGVRVILVSPDGPLNGLSWAALPGSKEGTFLVHEYAFAVVPVPHLLPELLRAPPQRAKRPPSLLLVGGIDFGQAKEHDTEPRSGKLPRVPVFRFLHGTESEVIDIRDTIRRRLPRRTSPNGAAQGQGDQDGGPGRRAAASLRAPGHQRVFRTAVAALGPRSRVEPIRQPWRAGGGD